MEIPLSSLRPSSASLASCSSSVEGFVCWLDLATGNKNDEPRARQRQKNKDNTGFIVTLLRFTTYLALHEQKNQSPNITPSFIQPCRLTIASIQIGAKGDVQPLETG